MGALSIKTDSQQFMKQLDGLLESQTPKIQKCLFKLGMKILNDAIMIAPRPPIATGTLRGSGAVAVGGKVMFQGIAAGGDVGEPDTSGMGPFSLRISFNTAYALRWHESTNWKPVPKPDAPGEESEVGPKYLSSKLDRFRGENDRLLADLMREEFAQ